MRFQIAQLIKIWFDIQKINWYIKLMIKNNHHEMKLFLIYLFFKIIATKGIRDTIKKEKEKEKSKLRIG